MKTIILGLGLVILNLAVQTAECAGPKNTASNQVRSQDLELSCAATKWDGDNWDEIDLGTGSAEAGLGIGLLAMSGLGVFFVWPGRAKQTGSKPY